MNIREICTTLHRYLPSHTYCIHVVSVKLVNGEMTHYAICKIASCTIVFLYYINFTRFKLTYTYECYLTICIYLGAVHYKLGKVGWIKMYAGGRSKHNVYIGANKLCIVEIRSQIRDIWKQLLDNNNKKLENYINTSMNLRKLSS